MTTETQTDASKRGRRSRNKGRAFEQLVARKLRAHFPAAKRGFQSRGGTAEAPDVTGTPFYVECKHGKPARDWQGALIQALQGSRERARGTGHPLAGTPVCVVREDRGPILVGMYLQHASLLSGGVASLSEPSEQGLKVLMTFEQFLFLCRDVQSALQPPATVVPFQAADPEQENPELNERQNVSHTFTVAQHQPTPPGMKGLRDLRTGQVVA